MRKKYNYRIFSVACRCLFIFLCSIGSFSCIREEFKGNSHKDASVLLSIRLPEEMKTNNISARAGIEDFNRIYNLLVAAFNGEELVFQQYFNTIGNVDGDPSMTLESDGSFKIHISEEKNIPSESTIHILANYGKEVDPNISLTDFKKIKQSDDKGIPIGRQSYMYGEAKSIGTDFHGGKKMSVELRRTIAVISVVMDGRELAEGVTIKPTKISLHNVPTACTISPNSKVGDNEVGVIANGEFKEIANATEWGTLRRNTLIGDGKLEDGIIKFNESPVYPLFLFENMNGEGESSTTEMGKRPLGCEDNRNAIENAIPNYSYLQIDATYSNLSDPTKPVSGNVAFKFLLGKDAIKNFDVERDHHYQITLKLSNYAVSESGKIDEYGKLIPNKEDMSWRIDSKLSDFTIHTDDNLNFNSSGGYLNLQVEAGRSDQWILKAKQGDLEFVRIYGHSDGSAMWQTATGGVTGSGSSENLQLYVEPFDPSTYSFVKGDYREITIYLTSVQNPDKTSSFTIKQYKMIEAKSLAGETFYIDRIDREAMPWGFFGEDISHYLDRRNGFQNTRDLIEEHNGTAYFPFGTQLVQSNNGSAPMFAVYIDHYARNSNPPIPGQEPTGAPDWDASLEWRYTIPSIAEWQAIEKNALIDPDYPLDLHLPYWTSNAVMGTDDAYAYQIGQGYDKIQEGEPYPEELKIIRTTPLRFRCIAVRNPI